MPEFAKLRNSNYNQDYLFMILYGKWSCRVKLQRPSIFLFILISFALSACGGTSEQSIPPTATETLAGVSSLPRRLTPTNTPTLTNTATNTATSTPSNTATNTPTYTPSSTATNTLTNTPTNTATNTLTSTPTNTPINTFTPVPTATIEPANTGVSIEYGETGIIGLIQGESRIIEYVFEGQAGDEINIQMISTTGTLDTYLYLFDPNNVLLVENDDDLEGDGTDSFIHNFILPATGTYTILATRFDRGDESSTGAFELILTSVTALDGGELVFDVTEDGTIADSAYEVAYTFDALDDDVVNIRVVTTSGDLDPLVRLLDVDGNQLIQNDDESGSSTNSLIDGFVIPSTGVYTIIVTRLGGSIGATSGNYEILVSKGIGGGSVDPVVTDGTYIPDVIDGNIVIGNFITDEITDERSQRYYTFVGQVDDSISIRMDGDSGDLDPLLILLDPAGREIARNDDRGGSLNSEIDNITLPFDGTYTIVASRFSQQFGSTTGEFTLDLFESSGRMIEAIVPREIEYGAFELGNIEAEFAFEVYTFFGTRSDLINVEMFSGDDSMSVLFILMDNQAREIVRSDHTLLTSNLDDAAIYNFPLPYSGYYTILARSFDGSGDYDLELTLEQSGDPNGDLPLIAVIEPNFSYGYVSTDDGFLSVYSAAGDWTSDGDDYEAGTLLTLFLPEIPEGESFASATLSLDTCEFLSDGSFVNTSVFGDFGGILTIYLNNRFEDVTQIDGSINVTTASVIDDIRGCEIVDMTATLRDAYADNYPIIQLYLSFGAPTINNSAIDAVIFEDTRLLIFTD